MKLVDSVGWVEYLSGGTAADAYYEHLRDAGQIITPSIVLYEVYKRVLRDADRRSAAIAAAQIMKTNVVELDSALAVSAAECSLKFKLPMADAIIYATALSCGVDVVTSDNHFAGLPGVIFVDKR